MDCVLTDVHLATFASGTPEYGEQRHAAIGIRDERIAWLGSAEEGRRIARSTGARLIELAAHWVTPGLIDCHTHLVYGGNRAQEFEQRLNGISYEQIAARGGGIASTMRATDAATEEELLTGALARVRRLSAEGVTTLEIKSGYGSTLESERRLLAVARQLGAYEPVSITTTYLGLHALPARFGAARGAFVDQVCDVWLPNIARAQLADAVDAFCESMAFSLSETDRYLSRARDLGLGIHLHAGQLSDMGAAQLAARHGALSVDHLEYAGEAAVAALAEAGSAAVLLPCAYYTLRQTQPPPVQRLRKLGVPMAVATDSNPGTSPCTSLLLAMNMACTLFGLTPAESLAGATREAAKALNIAADRGTLDIGKRADLAVFRVDHPAEIIHALGANPCVARVHRGVWQAA